MYVCFSMIVIMHQHHHQQQLQVHYQKDEKGIRLQKIRNGLTGIQENTNNNKMLKQQLKSDVAQVFYSRKKKIRSIMGIWGRES